MYCWSIAFTVCQLSRRSSATSVIDADRHCFPRYSANRRVVGIRRQPVESRLLHATTRVTRDATQLELHEHMQRAAGQIAHLAHPARAAVTRART